MITEYLNADPPLAMFVLLIDLIIGIAVGHKIWLRVRK